MTKVYTTGKLAAILHVAPRTVAKWADSGILKSERLPMGKHDRRIYHGDVVQFLRDRGMVESLREFSAGQTGKLLMVGVNQKLLDGILLTVAGAPMLVAKSFFQAGMLYQAHGPAGVAIDFSMGRAESLCVAQLIRKDKVRPSLLAITYDDEQGQPDTFDHSFSHIVTPQEFLWVAGRLFSFQ